MAAAVRVQRELESLFGEESSIVQTLPLQDVRDDAHPVIVSPARGHCQSESASAP